MTGLCQQERELTQRPFTVTPVSFRRKLLGGVSSIRQTGNLKWKKEHLNREDTG